jgi:hypothetical protein
VNGLRCLNRGLGLGARRPIRRVSANKASVESAGRCGSSLFDAAFRRWPAWSGCGASGRSAAQPVTSWWIVKPRKRARSPSGAAATSARNWLTA